MASNCAKSPHGDENAHSFVHLNLDGRAFTSNVTAPEPQDWEPMTKSVLVIDLHNDNGHPESILRFESALVMAEIWIFGMYSFDITMPVALVERTLAFMKRALQYWVVLSMRRKA